MNEFFKSKIVQITVAILVVVFVTTIAVITIYYVVSPLQNCMRTLYGNEGQQMQFCSELGKTW